MKRLFIAILLVAGMATPTTTVSGDGPNWVVSCLGDSITEGIPYLGTENTYPARLQVMLDSAYGSGSYQVINHGVGGWRADQVRDHTQGWMTEDNPDYVLLLVGGNDLAQLQSIESTVAEVQEIVNIVKAQTNPDDSHPQIIVSAILPNLISELATWWVSVYNDSLESDLTEVDLWFTSNWDDFYDPATGQAKASLMSDTVHPNVSGYIVMAENWFEELGTLIGPTAVTLSSFSATPLSSASNSFYSEFVAVFQQSMSR
jgi:lysophospholipase L1-like esterase